tara:strand:+ start:707 stop:1105 length:399 start_codon:yes stop_codon:yes gene_type:complete
MKSPFLISAIFIVFSFVFASENISITGEKSKDKNSGSNIQAIDSEVLPVDIEKITKTRIEKSIMDKKYAQKILEKHTSSEIDQKEELLSEKVDKNTILKKMSADIRSKLSVVKFKGKAGEKSIDLPSIPESN